MRHRRRLSTIGYLTMAAALLNVTAPCAPTQNVSMPTTTTTTASVLCTTANVPNQGSRTTSPAVATAGPGQSVTLACIIVSGGTVAYELIGDNGVDTEFSLFCTSPCTTSPLTITCDGITGRFTFVPTAGPNTGTSVALGSIGC